MEDAPELKIDVPEMRAQMGRANVTQIRLSELAGVHFNTVGNVLRSNTADLDTVAALTNGLNIALRAEGQQEIGPYGLLIATGGWVSHVIEQRQ